MDLGVWKGKAFCTSGYLQGNIEIGNPTRPNPIADPNCKILGVAIILSLQVLTTAKTDQMLLLLRDIVLQKLRLNTGCFYGEGPSPQAFIGSS